MTRFVALVFVALLAIGGCDNDSDDSKGGAKKKPTDPLATIAPKVWIMKVMNAGWKMSSCATSKMQFKTSSKDNEIVGHVIREMVEKAKRECAFWKTIVAPATEPLFDRIVRERAVPPKIYSFTIFTGSGEVAYSKDEVGVFSNIKTCREIEAQYREFGEGSGRCREWKDPDLELMKRLKKTLPR